MHRNNSTYSKSILSSLPFWLASILLGSLLCCRAEEPLKLSATIPLPNVKGGFDLMAIDLPSKRVFLNAEDNNSMEIIDVADNRHLRSVGGLTEPKWVVYRPESHKLYVANGGDGSVRILDSRTFKESKRISFKEKANNLRYDSKSRLLYVGVGKTFGSLGIVDTSNDTIAGEIPLANFPKQFELEKTGKRIFVNVPAANHIEIVDRETRSAIATWPVREAKENVPLAFDEIDHRLLIGCATGKLVVMDSNSGASVATVEIAEDCDSVYYDAKRKVIYISCGAGFIDVVRQHDANHYQRIAHVPTVSGAATSLFVPELNRIFLAVPQKDQQQAELRVYNVQ